MGLGPPASGRKSRGTAMLQAAQKQAQGKLAHPTPKRAAHNVVVFERQKKARLTGDGHKRQDPHGHQPDATPPPAKRPATDGPFDGLACPSPARPTHRPQLPLISSGYGSLPYARWRDPTSTQLLARGPMLLGSQTSSGLARQPALPAGMLNLGNTCYLNAVLQALLSLPTFVADLQALGQRLADAAAAAAAQQRPLPTLPAAGVCSGLLQCLTAKGSLASAGGSNGSGSVGSGGLLGRAGAAGRNYIVPASLKAAIDARAAAFVGCFQQDAHEFLCKLLQGMQEEVLACEAVRLGRPQVRVGETADPVARSLGLALEHQLACSACGHVSRVVEQYTHLSLELPEGDFSDPSSVPPDVASLLKCYFQEEAVEKSCEACAAVNVQHSLSHRIRRLPRVLTLHLKRFKVVVAGSSPSAAPVCMKLHTPVGLVETLRLRPFMTQDCRPPLPAPPACKGTAAGKENAAAAANQQQQQQQPMTMAMAGGGGEQTPAASLRGPAAPAAMHGLKARAGFSFYSGGGVGGGSMFASPAATSGGLLSPVPGSSMRLPVLRGSAGAGFLRKRPAGGSTSTSLEFAAGAGSTQDEEAELQRALELSALEYEQQQQQQHACGAGANPPAAAAVAGPPGAAKPAAADGDAEDEQLQRALALSLQEQQQQASAAASTAAAALWQGSAQAAGSPRGAGLDKAQQQASSALDLMAEVVMQEAAEEQHPWAQRPVIVIDLEGHDGERAEQQQGPGVKSPQPAVGPVAEIVEDDWQPASAAGCSPAGAEAAGQQAVPAAGAAPAAAAGPASAAGAAAGPAGKSPAQQQQQQQQAPLLAQYRLVATVSHKGAGASSGHFTADTREDGSGSWFRHDDSVVNRIGSREALGPAAQRQAYLLFYTAAWSDM